MIADTFIICERDKYIALDNNSGGYPYRVDSPWEARHWPRLQDAKDYRGKFSRENWTIKVFRATALWDVTNKFPPEQGER